MQAGEAQNTKEPIAVQIDLSGQTLNWKAGSPCILVTNLNWTTFPDSIAIFLILAEIRTKQAPYLP